MCSRARTPGAFGAPARGGRFAYRRVKNDVRGASDLADLLRIGRLPEAWIAPAPVRELREAVRHRAKLVALRIGLKAQVHAVSAKQGVTVPMSDLFGVAGGLLDDLRLDPAYNARVVSLRRVIDALNFEIDVVARRTATMATHPGYRGGAGHRRCRSDPYRDLRRGDR